MKAGWSAGRLTLGGFSDHASMPVGESGAAKKTAARKPRQRLIGERLIPRAFR